MAAKDYTNIGMTFGKLTVIGIPFPDKYYIYKVLCECSCGTQSLASCRQLLIGQTKSCGCLRSESAKSRRIDLSLGDRSGKLTVIAANHSGGGKNRTCLCKCDCGNEVVVGVLYFREQKTKSCGCLARDRAREIHPVPIGARYGMTIVLGEAETTTTNRKVRAICDCGVEFSVAINNLRSGHTKSCGCALNKARAALATHGFTRKFCFNRTYSIYRDMRTRCENPKYKKFHLYGGRGIKVCDRWNNFENFLADMGERPEGLSLERNDVNGDYGPNNCRWASSLDQANNKRNNVFLEYCGKRMTVAQWARELNMKAGTIYHRVSHGWPPERVLSSKK